MWRLGARGTKEEGTWTSAGSGRSGRPCGISRIGTWIRTTCSDPDDIKVRNPDKKMLMPDCEKCTERCCVHDDPGSGILLSLYDVAHLVDAGLAHLIVGTYTFRRNKKGRILDEIDRMPRLAKQPDGNCHFYDPATGRCGGYGVRPTICRRFPYEVHYKKKSGKPFARFIGWSQCPTQEGPEFEASIKQMARDAVVDENVSFEDAVLLGEHVEALRAAGFRRVPSAAGGVSRSGRVAEGVGLGPCPLPRRSGLGSRPCRRTRRSLRTRADLRCRSTCGIASPAT